MNKKRLLIGPAGCGKTSRLLADFESTLKEASDPLQDDCFFLLPSAEHSERIISTILQRGVPGFFHRRVTTLSRLITASFGIGEERIASSVTRYLILRKILSENRWPYFQEVQDTPGFLNVMLSFISELKESRISPALFRERINSVKKAEPVLAAKHEALAAVYEWYENELKERKLMDRPDVLGVFLERSQRENQEGNRFRKLWLDGFFDFSEVQLAYLNELSSMADETTVTLTVDETSGREALFDTVQRTRKLLENSGFEVEVMRERVPKDARGKVLWQVGRSLFSQNQKEEAIALSPAVAVFESVGIEGEVEMIARTILHMMKTGEFRFSDFSVLLRNMAGYESVIRSIFHRYDLPVELHERERLRFAPLVHVIVKLLLIFRDGWKVTDVMEFLKSTYVRKLGSDEKDYEWIARLEHEAMKRGVYQGRDAWLEPWPETDDETFDQQKEERLGVLASLEDQLNHAASVSETATVLKEAIEKTFRIFERSSVNVEYVRRDAVSYGRFQSLLQEIETMFRSSGDKGFSFNQFADRFFRLVDLDLYSLHNRDRNRVQIYTVSLARQKEYKVVFLAGLLESVFPVQVKEDPLMSDWERRLFNAERTEGRLKEKLPSQLMERYLFYIAVTRASHKLILSYPKLDLEGKASLRSYYVQEVIDLFGGKLEPRSQKLGRPYPGLDDAVSVREAEMSVLGELWHAPAEAREQAPLIAVMNRFLKEEASREHFRKAFYKVTDAIIDKKIHELDPFKSALTSSTRLEEYAKCHFKYYANYVLKLVDPEENVNVLRRGTILHEVLELCFREWAKAPSFFEDTEKAKKEAGRKLEEAFKKYPLIHEKKYQLDLEKENMRETLFRFLDYELERLRESPLKPFLLEYDFGGEDGDAPPLSIQSVQGEILIRGKIDRVDLAREEGVGAVIDYKRTAVFDKSALEFGTSLQLPIYTMVLEKFLKKKAAGAELYSLTKTEKKGFYREEYLHLFPGMSKRRMLLSESEFNSVVERAEWFIQRFSLGMRALDIEVKPRDCASYCPYSPVCRIEKWKLPAMAQELRDEDEKLWAVRKSEQGVSR